MAAAKSTAKSGKAHLASNKDAAATSPPQQGQKQQPQTNGADAEEDEHSDEEEPSTTNTNGQSTSAPKKKKKKPAAKKKKSPTSASATHPLSTLDPTLPLPPGVAQHYFDPVKGKGLIATRDFAEGEDVFGDSAFVSAPPMAQAKKVGEGELCNECFQPIEAASPALVVRCRRAGASSSAASGCGAAWCNRDCESRGRSKHHNLLCRTNNPASAPFLDFMAQGHAYLSLHSAARLYASILLCHSSTPPPAPYKSGEPATMEETLRHAKAFATIHEVARKRRNPGWDIEKKAWEATLKKALELLRAAIDPYEEKRLEAGGQGGIRGKGKWIVEPKFPRAVAQELFGWEGFMRSLGRANLNLESQGSLYLLHSHLNHSCSPNLQAHHPPHPRTRMRQATKVLLTATRPIAKGEELTITYQDPRQGVRRRNLLLWREHMFGPCGCERCEEELAQLEGGEEERKRVLTFEGRMDEEDRAEVEARRMQAKRLMEEQGGEGGGKGGAKGGEKDLSGLEEELRAKLGF